MNLESITAGTRVWIEEKRCGVRMRIWRPILRVSRTQLICDLRRYRRADGTEVGGLTGKIVGVATDEEIADFEVEKAAHTAREKVLEMEHKALQREVNKLDWQLQRIGDKYIVTVPNAAPAQVRAMFAAMKGVRR